MTYRIIIIMMVGVLAGRWMPLKALTSHLDTVVTIGLCILLFFVGIDIGRNKNILHQLKEEGFGILILPISVILGSIGGSFIAGLCLGIPYQWAGAIGSGFGWYTLSAVMLTKVSTQLGALAFLTNVFREVIAIMIIPVVAKKLGGLVAIAPAGATAMDTTLPVITRAAGSDMAIAAFISGAVLSALVPVLVSLMISL